MMPVMREERFCHLHCHTHYSLLDGANRIGPLVHRASDLGMKSLAITDHGNMFGDRQAEFCLITGRERVLMGC